MGRMGSDQMVRYTDDNARVQVDPALMEVSGAMPEISPSPDFGSNIDKPFNERSSGLQAWGTYGVLWPVVHFELGVAPDMGRHDVSVVPQIPDGQHSVAGSNIKLGGGSIDVEARRGPGTTLSTTVRRHVRTALTIGAVLPDGTHPTAVLLNGSPVRHRVARTARGLQVLVDLPAGESPADLQVSYG
jgi:hypothetical protein